MANELTVRGWQSSLCPQKGPHSRHNHGMSAQPSSGLGFVSYTFPVFHPVLGILSRAVASLLWVLDFTFRVTLGSKVQQDSQALSDCLQQVPTDLDILHCTEARDESQPVERYRGGKNNLWLLMLSRDSSLFLHENPIISLDLKLFKCLNACGYFQ